jgi:CubicO group peptidase (beta-lactamase class C family)
MRRAIVILGLTTSALAGDGPTALPIERGDQAQADPRVNALLETIRDRHDLPALGGAIVTSERLVAVGAVGLRKHGDDQPVTVHDQFHLGSCTKAMTATLLALLVRDGALSWDTPLERALPGYRREMHPDYRPVTLEQVLAHRSGFSGETAARDLSLIQMHKLNGSNRERRRIYLRRILAEPPTHPIGERFVYSNRNYVVAGAIAEEVTGEAWETLMTHRLFEPLGMASAGFGAMGRPGRVDQPWPHLVVQGQPRPVPPGPRSDNPSLIGPAGTVHASLADWGKFLALHLRAGRRDGDPLLPEAIQRLRKPYPGPGDRYGFGWGFHERPWGGGTVLAHAGSNTMNYAVVWMAPARDFAVLAVTNQGGDAAETACDEVARDLIRFYLESDPVQPPPAPAE